MLFTQILGKERERKGLGTHRVRVRRSWWRRMRTRRSAAHDKGKRWGGRRQIWRWQRACGTTVAGGAVKLEGLGGSGLPAERVSTPAAEVEVDGAQVVAGKTPRGRPFATADRAEGWAHGALAAAAWCEGVVAALMLGGQASDLALYARRGKRAAVGGIWWSHGRVRCWERARCFEKATAACRRWTRWGEGLQALALDDEIRLPGRRWR
ncbi:leucine-rich repeat extensin-like protein 3 [Iris pallida]|uniref:Leucine-rich repeat extensin-like protein 3 n=1 Tax=Iris pallida TaxID=29817 RepID=A0AAX6GGU7_IRIPA|nr:leucine-rich repeat extensin-like protein 3 [Iris pallida]